MPQPPVYARNYPTYLWQYVTDKTGTVFQTLAGRLDADGPWGTRVWRCPPNGKPELVYFIQDGNGALTVDVVNKRLLFLTTDKNWMPNIVVIEGYVFPTDYPDVTVVNINETQVATLKQSIATAQAMANTANTTANVALRTANNAEDATKILTDKVNALQGQVQSLQAQVNSLLTPNQVADLVWQKIKDVNYLYRLAFIAYPKPDPDPDIRAYVNDLVGLIKKVK